MAFNGAGTYVRVHDWSQDEIDGVLIQGDRMDEEFDDQATALSQCITKNGETTITANIPMAGFKFTGLGDATAATDALNRQTGDARYHPIGAIITTDNAIARYNGTVGALQNSGVIIDDSDGLTAASFASSASNTSTRATHTSTDAGAGSWLTTVTYRNSATPAASDIIGSHVWRGKDNAANDADYGYIGARILDTTDTSEDGQVVIGALIAGTATDILKVGPGVSVGTAVDQGANTFNAGTLYEGGTAVSAIYAGITTLQTLQNKTLDNTNIATIKDGNLSIVGSSDTTKIVKFEVDGLTTGTTRTITVPDADMTLVGLTTTQTLTNKTLTSPVIATISNTGTITLPTSTDTLVGRATTDTLTNKTISSGVFDTSMLFNTNQFAATSSTGVVGIGTVTAIDISSGTADGFSFETVGAALGKLSMSRSANPALNIRRRTSDGQVALFTRDTTSVGSISVTTTNTAFNTTSDYRLKENVRDIGDVDAVIDAIQPRRFQWKSNGSDAVGFIAHELQAAVPEAVTGEKDGKEMQEVDFSKIVPYLVAEAQSVRRRLAALEAQ